MLTPQSISIRNRNQAVEAQDQVIVDSEISAPDQVISKFRKLILWQFQRYGVPDEETDEVMAEVNLYMAEQWHRYDPAKSAPQTFLAWQVRGAIRRWQRREGRFKCIVDNTITTDDEGQEENTLDTLPDITQSDGRDVEAQIMMRENLMNVLKVAKERGINVNLNSTRMSRATKEALRAIWIELTGEPIGAVAAEAEKEAPAETQAAEETEQPQPAEDKQHRCPVCSRFMTRKNPTCKEHGTLAEAQALAQKNAQAVVDEQPAETAEAAKTAKNPRWRPTCPVCRHLVSPKTRRCKVHGSIDAPIHTEKPGQPKCPVCRTFLKSSHPVCKKHGPLHEAQALAERLDQSPALETEPSAPAEAQAAPAQPAETAKNPRWRPSCPVCGHLVSPITRTCRVHGSIDAPAHTEKPGQPKCPVCRTFLKSSHPVCKKHGPLTVTMYAA